MHGAVELVAHLRKVRPARVVLRVGALPAKGRPPLRLGLLLGDGRHAVVLPGADEGGEGAGLQDDPHHGGRQVER